MEGKKNILSLYGKVSRHWGKIGRAAEVIRKKL